MQRKLFASAAFGAIVLFLVTYAVVAASRPEYDFRYKAISELGSVDVPDRLFWNVFGYIVPGLLIAAFSVGLYRHFSTTSRVWIPSAGLFFSGLLMSLSGMFPADMDNRQSFTMLMHTLGSFGSFAAFLVAAFTFPKVWRLNDSWRTRSTPSLVVTWLAITFGAWPMIFPAMPAVGQRVVFLFYFAWIALAAAGLLRSVANNEKQHR